MPNYYAHLKFGGRVLEQLPAPLADTLREERAAFDLGCLGPDPLFFYHILHPSAVRREGLRLHRQSALAVAARLRQSIEAGTPLARGYGAGFLCHLALDSACHGYVYRQAEEGPVTHMAMEGEFDRMLMLEDAKNPFTHNPAAYCDASIKSAKIIAPLFPGVSPGQIREGIIGMKMARGLVRCNWLPKRVVLYHLTKLVQLKGMVLTESVRPSCLMSNKQLHELFDAAVPETARMIENYDRQLFTDKPLCKRFHRNYETRHLMKSQE